MPMPMLGPAQRYGTLKQILAYHLHNNDGVHDSHRRIGDGTLDFDSFMAWAGEYTPQADLVVEYGMETADDCRGIEGGCGAFN